MTMKLPPGVSLYGVPDGGVIADSEWVVTTLDETVPANTPGTVSEQLRKDADL